MNLSFTLILIAQPLGALSRAELDQVAARSFQISLREFRIEEEARLHQDRWAQTFSFPVIAPLVASIFTTRRAIAHPKLHTRCQTSLKRLAWGSSSLGLVGLSAFQVNRIWSRDITDSEISWLIAHQADFESKAMDLRQWSLRELYRAALRRDVPSAKSIEIAFTDPKEIWSGIPERAWLDGKPLRAEFVVNPNGLSIDSFCWREE